AEDFSHLADHLEPVLNQLPRKRAWRRRSRLRTASRSAAARCRLHPARILRHASAASRSSRCAASPATSNAPFLSHSQTERSRTVETDIFAQTCFTLQVGLQFGGQPPTIYFYLHELHCGARPRKRKLR